MPHLYKKALASTQKASELHDLRLIQPLRAFDLTKALPAIKSISVLPLQLQKFQALLS